MFSIKTKKEIDYLNSFSAFFFLQIKYFCKPFTALKKSFENILGKGENGGNEKHHPVIETLKNEAFYWMESSTLSDCRKYTDSNVHVFVTILCDILTYCINTLSPNSAQLERCLFTKYK